MRLVRCLSVVIVAFAVFAGAVYTPSTHAQDAMVQCDSDLILSLYVAEYYFGFGALSMAMMEEGMEGVDVSTIDKGEFAPLFEGMMGMMDESMMMEGMMVDAETLAAIGELMSEDAMMAAMEGMMMEETTMLPGLVVEEAPECAALRGELHIFYAALALHDGMMMMMDEG